MTSYGTVTDYADGITAIRPATAAEWLKTAYRLAGIEHSAGDAYSGAWQDEDGRVVIVIGGPDDDVSADDVRALRDEAAAAGDLERVHMCEVATGDAADSPRNPRGFAQGNGPAFAECAKVILENRMRVAEDATTGAS